MSLSDFAEKPTADVAKAFKVAPAHKQAQYFAELFELFQAQDAASQAEIADLSQRASDLEQKLAADK